MKPFMFMDWLIRRSPRESATRYPISARYTTTEQHRIYASYALFCEEIAYLSDGTISLERVKAGCIWTIRPNDSPAVAGGIPVVFAACLHCATARRGVHLELWCIRPDGARSRLDHQTINLKGNHQHCYTHWKMPITLDQPGVHLYEIAVDGAVISTTPLTKTSRIERIQHQSEIDFTTNRPSRIPSKRTGLTNAKCYAAVLGGCSSKISREHFISNSALRVLEADGPLLVSGLPWLKPGETKALSSATLTANILCREHNSLLSGLDAVGKNFFLALETINKELENNPAGRDRLYKFSGADIERWLLKMLVGTAFSSNVSTSDGVIKGWKPPDEWIRILFGEMRLPDGRGLYLPSKTGTIFTPEHNIALTVAAKEKVILGARFSINGYPFILSLVDPPDDPTGTDLENAVYHPQQFRLIGPGSEKAIDFGWSGKVVAARYDRP